MKRIINILWYIFTYLVRCGFRYLFVVFFLFLFIFFLSIIFCIKGHVHTHINKLLSRRQNVTLNLQYDGLLVMMSRYVSPRNLVKLSQFTLMPFYLQRPQTQNYWVTTFCIVFLSFAFRVSLPASKQASTKIRAKIINLFVCPLLQPSLAVVRGVSPGKSKWLLHQLPTLLLFSTVRVSLK